MKRKILITIAIIIFLAIAAVLILFFNGKNKANIIKSVSQKISEINNEKDQNMYFKQIDIGYGYSERYVLNDKEKIITYDSINKIKYIDIFDSTKLTSYIEDEVNNKKIMYVYTDENYEDYEDYKEAAENTSNNSFVDKLEEVKETIQIGLSTSIKTININGTNCYAIGETGNPDGSSTMYVEKSTYLPIKLSVNDNGTEVTIFEYYYNVVTEDDVKLLNDKEYKKVTEEEFEKYYYSE